MTVFGLLMFFDLRILLRAHFQITFLEFSWSGDFRSDLGDRVVIGEVLRLLRRFSLDSFFDGLLIWWSFRVRLQKLILPSGFEFNWGWLLIK